MDANIHIRHNNSSSVLATKKSERYELVVVPICFYMSLAARGKAVMMTTIKTVADLKKEIQVFKSENGLIPGAVKLYESEVPVLYRMEKESCDLELNVYENGLVFYRCGKYKTVFKLHIVPDSYISFSNDPATDPESAEVPWEIHLMLYGEDKILYNQDDKEHRLVTIISDLRDGELETELPDPINRDPEEELIRKESLNLIYSWITELQAKVFRLVYEEQLTQKEAAARLGLSQQAVAKAISRVYVTVRKHKNELFS